MLLRDGLIQKAISFHSRTNTIFQTNDLAFSLKGKLVMKQNENKNKGDDRVTQ